MQHHGLGHMPQPDNFTTCGKLGIEVNQYNNPVEVSKADMEKDIILSRSDQRFLFWRKTMQKIPAIFVYSFEYFSEKTI